MARYAQLAAGYLISAASDLLGDVVPLHVVAPMFEVRSSTGHNAAGDPTGRF